MMGNRTIAVPMPQAAIILFPIILFPISDPSRTCGMDDFDMPPRTLFLVRIVCASWLVAGVGERVRADDAAAPTTTSKPADLASRVESLVKQLDGATLAVRTAAERALLELGPSALPHLPAPELLPNASVREGVRRVRVSLERRQAEESILPSRVTLAGERPLADALRSIAMQTGNPIDIAAVPAALAAKPVRTDFDGATFWEAIDELAGRAGMRLAARQSRAGLRLVPADSAAEPDDAGRTSPEIAVGHSGPFRLAIESATLRPLVGDDTARLLRVKANLLVEPRLRPLLLRFAVRNIEAKRNDGTALMPFTPEAKYEAPFTDGGERVSLTCDYRLPNEPEGEPLRSVSLAGRLSLLTAAATHEFQFRDLDSSAGIARRRGGVTVTLQKASFSEPVDGARDVRVQIATAYDTGGIAFESYRTWIFHNDSHLEDAEGRRIERDAGYSTELQSDGAVAVGYTFPDVKGDPSRCRFFYFAPTSLIDAPIEFRIEGIAVGATK